MHSNQQQRTHIVNRGAIYFTFNMIWSICFPFAAQTYYTSNVVPVVYETVGADGEVSEETNFLPVYPFRYFLLLNALLWCCAFAGLILVSRDGYISRTFFSFKTGSDYVAIIFHEAPDDESKFLAAFDNHRKLWRGIEPEIKKWVAERYSSWHEDNPGPWFADILIPVRSRPDAHEYIGIVFLSFPPLYDLLKKHFFFYSFLRRTTCCPPRTLPTSSQPSCRRSPRPS